jgi:glycopeptide antibiotics resistance protein
MEEPTTEQKAKNNIIRSISWITFVVYIVTLYKIAVFKYMPISIICEQFRLVDPDRIGWQLTSANFMPLRSIIWYAFEDQSAAPVNIVGNIITFMPLSIFLPFVLGNTSRLKVITLGLKTIALIGFASSFSIEAVQLIFGLGCFDIDDIILNTLGACLGFFVYRAIKRIPEHLVLADSVISLHNIIMGTLFCLTMLFNFLLLAGYRFF